MGPVVAAAVVALAVVTQAMIVLLPVEPAERAVSAGPPRTDLLIRDDFTSGSGWAAISTDQVSLGYRDAGYVLVLQRPHDDGRSVMLLPGPGRRSVAATATAQVRSPTGGLVGVGCAANEDRMYEGAVDPLSSGFVILRVDGSAVTVLRAGWADDGVLVGTPQYTDVRIECTAGPAAGTPSLIRLFANGHHLGTARDPAGFGPLHGMSLAGMSLRRPLQAWFGRAALQILPAVPGSALRSGCDDLSLASSLEADYQWLSDSGGTGLATTDSKPQGLRRVAAELAEVASSLRADADRLGSAGGSASALRKVAGALGSQHDSLVTLTMVAGARSPDPDAAKRTLGCAADRPGSRSAWASATATIAPVAPAISSGLATMPGLDERLVDDLPAPVFVADDVFPAEPDLSVIVTMRYDFYPVSGTTLLALNRDMVENGPVVDQVRAYAMTGFRIEWADEEYRGPLGCDLDPTVTVRITIRLPFWDPPAGSSRYLVAQWNQFMWELDEHERHHASLAIGGANKAAGAFVRDSPPTCAEARTAAHAAARKAVRAMMARQKAFDRDVQNGTLPRPTLP